MFNIQNKYVGPGCYRFLDQEAKVIYVGTSKNVHRRLFSQHFKKNGTFGHLPECCYNSTCKLEIVKTKDYAQALAFEQFAIDKYIPKYNNKDKRKDIFNTSNFDNIDLYKKLDNSWKSYYTFREYDFNKIKLSKRQNYLGLAVTLGFFVVLLVYVGRGLL